VDLLNFASSNFQFMFLMSTYAVSSFLFKLYTDVQQHAGIMLTDQHGVDDVQGLRLSCKNMMPIHILGHYDVDIIWFPSNIST